MKDEEYLKDILPKLKEEMPYKWRVQSFSKSIPQATCVAYIDARNVMDRLDEVCIYGWNRDHREIKGHVYAGIGIVMPSGRELWRWDCGVESNTEAEKGESSDSFKRAAVNWGIGRFLYDLKIQYVTASEIKKDNPKNWPYVIDDRGKKVYDITKHINNLNNKQVKPKEKEELTVDAIKLKVKNCKTIADLDKLMDINKSFIKSLFEKEKKEVISAFTARKNEINLDTDNSQGMRND